MVQDRKIARRVRLADVAAEAGVSSMTVSEILRPRNSRIQVSEKTRLRVLEAVKRLNYQPNLQAPSGAFFHAFIPSRPTKSIAGAPARTPHTECPDVAGAREGGRPHHIR